MKDNILSIQNCNYFSKSSLTINQIGLINPVFESDKQDNSLNKELKFDIQYPFKISLKNYLSSYTTDKHEDEIANRSFIEKIITLIENNIDKESFNVNTICKMMCMSRTNLHNKVKKHTGKSIINLIKAVRLNKAAELLNNHSFTVNEVMYLVGITSPSYFTRFFKKEFGVTPSEYARRKTYTI